MATVVEIQEQMCLAIASIDAGASREEISRILDPILESFQQANDLTTETLNVGVTPLIVACDKAQALCIEWIWKKVKHSPSSKSLLGSPLDHVESGNTPAHYAANSGCSPAMKLLCEMMGDHEGTSNRALKLASQRNENYDTPVMLAAFGGHVSFLRQIKTLVEDELANSSDAKKIFVLVNNDGETALSLACGHGHVEVVNFLVQEAGVTVSYDHVIEAEQTLQLINAALISSPSLADHHRDRLNDVQRCILVLKDALAKAAQVSMEELLAEEEMEKAKNQGDKAKKKKKRKTKPSRVLADGDTNSDNGLASLSQETRDHGCDDKDDTAVVDRRTSSTGPINALSANRGANKEEQTCDNTDQAVAPEETVEIAPKQVNTDIPTGPSKSGRDANLEVDSIIEALSLDTSMLLLNPTDMALNLSPCQLDAIAAVLRNQIQAVKEARRIQTRLRDQGRQP